MAMKGSAARTKGPITLLGVGDVSPNRDDPPSMFRYCKETFQKADIVFCQLEAPLSDRGKPTFTPYGGGSRLRPENIAAINEEGGGFDVVSFAGNHAMDYGEEAFLDTLDLLKKHGIAYAGAGRDIHEARQPAILERNGTTVGFLAYLSILPLGFEADEKVPGCAPLWAWDAYRQVEWQVGAPPLIISQLYSEYKEAMLEDIRKLRSQVDVLVVSIHAGVHFIPAFVTMYQKEAAYAAIDAGADLVLQHHAHILQGIETYKGKAIFYSLGNFAVEHSRPASWPVNIRARDPQYRTHREDFFHIRPIPGYPKYRYHFDALKTMVAKAYIDDGKIQKVTYLPAYITPDLEPELLKREDPRAQQVFDYVTKISDATDLKVAFSWDGQEVLVSPK